MKIRIFPSIMAKSQKELNEDLKRIGQATKILHLDVVDGKFANNKTLQFPFRLSKKFKYNAHLMIKNPERWIEKNLNRIDIFIPHFEEIKDIQKYIAWMKKKNKKVAFAILPETKIIQLKEFIHQIDYLLILTVHPGFYGSKFLKSKLKKIDQAKKLNPKIKIIVDGGMNPNTITLAKDADYFVSGSFTTKADNPKNSIKELMSKLKKC